MTDDRRQTGRWPSRFWWRAVSSRDPDAGGPVAPAEGWLSASVLRPFGSDSVSSPIALMAARGSAALISFLANIYLAKVLGAQDFGRYSLALAVLTFCSLFMDFGYFASGARLMIGTQDDDRKRSYIGALLLIGAGISLLFVGVVAGVGLVIDTFLAERIGPTLLAAAGLAPAMVLPFLFDQVLKASGRIRLLGAWQTIPRLVFLLAIVSVHAVRTLSTSTALVLFLTSGLVAVLPVTLMLRPSWKNAFSRLREIADEQRRFGRPLYVGKVANLASYNTDRLLLGWFRDAQAVGYYSLAMSIGGPVAMFAQSVAASHFKEFAHRRPIPSRLLRWNTLGTLLVSLAVLVAGNLVVLVYLGPGYSAVAVLLVVALIAIGFQAAYQPYNSWLLANGFGSELRNFLLVVAAINLAANLVLIPAAGAMGAALASAVGTGAYLVLAARIYRQQAVSRPS